VIIFFAAIFVQMVEDSICNPSYSPGVFADLFQKLRFLLIWFKFFHLCHFEMITWQEYLSFIALGYKRSEIHFVMYGIKRMTRCLNYLKMGEIFLILTNKQKG